MDTRTTTEVQAATTTGRVSVRELEGTLSRALAAAQIGVWSYDQVSREHWDRTTKALFGMLAEEEPTTDLFLACVHPDDRKRYAQAFSAAIDPNGKGYYECDFRIQRRDTGEERWLSSRGQAEFTDGRFIRLIGVVQDVTTQKRSEESARAGEEHIRRVLDSLREREQRFRGLFENAATGIALVGLDGEFQQCNPVFAKMLGYTEEEIRGVNLRSLIHPDDLSTLLEKNGRLVAGEIPSFEITNRYLRKDGSVRWSRRFVSLLRDADGRPQSVMVLATDMTERIAFEQKIGLLLREVNHRAKNMLGVVQAIARSTAASGAEDFQTRFAERIRALAAAHDLLVSNDWQGVDLAELVSSQLAHVGDPTGTRISIDGPSLRISGAAAQTLGMTLHELSTNAFKYGALSSEKGTVAIRWRTQGDQFAMDWIERGGPPVAESERSGFGTVVMDRMTRMTLGGEVEIDRATEGLCWHLRCPLAKITPMPLESK